MRFLILATLTVLRAAAADSLLIGGFDSPEEFLRWEKLRMPVQEAHQQFEISLANGALRVRQPLPEQRISVGLSEGLPPDWTAYQDLCWDLTFQDEAPANVNEITIYLAIDDALSNGDYNDCFGRSYIVKRKSTTHCRVSIDEIGTRCEMARIREIAFSYSGPGPTAFQLDNIRLEGKRAAPFSQKPPRVREHLKESGCQWIIGDDFKRFQIVADGYYEPKGFEPSDDQIASMNGLRFVEQSERAGSYEKCSVRLQLAPDQIPAFKTPDAVLIEHFDAGDLARADGRFGKGLRVGAGEKPFAFDPKLLHADEGAVQFWVRPEIDTIDQQGTRLLLHAFKDLNNQVRIGFCGGDLFFEIRVDGERHIVRKWTQTIWGDIRRDPRRWSANDWHHVRCQWGPEGMYLAIDDVEEPYNVWQLARPPEKEPAPTPYTGGLPAGLTAATLGSDTDGGHVSAMPIDDLQIDSRAPRGPRWKDRPYGRSGQFLSKPLDRGPRYAQPEFALGTFKATTVVPDKTALTFAFRTQVDATAAPSEWRDIKPGDAFPAEANQARFVQIKAQFSTNQMGRTPELHEYHVIQYNPPHPRVFLTKSQLTLIKERCAGKLKPFFEQYKGMVDSGLPGNDPFVSHTDCALLWHITGDKHYLDEAKRVFGNAMQKPEKPADLWDMMGLDWMLAGCDDAEKAKYLAYMLEGCGYGQPRHAVWWNQMYNGWRHSFHSTFIRNMALFGEESCGDIHRVRRSFFDHEDFVKAYMIPAFNECGGVWPEAFGYHAYTGAGPVLALEAWSNATGENIWPLATWTKDLGAWYFYCMRPYAHWTAMVNDDRSGVPMLDQSWVSLLAARLNDPFCQADATAAFNSLSHVNNLRPQIQHPYGYFNLLWWLLFYDPEIKPIDTTDLPTDRLFPGGMNWVSMRSDWTADATMGLFLWNDWYGGHKQRDTGAFQIHRKAELAVDPKDVRDVSEEWHGRYRMASVAHNVLLVSEPGEANPDGGQPQPGYDFPLLGDVIDDSTYDTAKPLAFQSTKDYCWTACDLSGAYRPDRQGLPRQVAKYVRQVVFLKPDVFVMADYVKLTDAKYRRAWLLHSYSQAQIPGAEKKIDDVSSVFTSSGPIAIAQDGGKLFVQTLLPKQVAITQRAHDVIKDGQPIPDRRVWQIEVDPAGKASDETVFLHVMQTATDQTQAMSECSAVDAGKGRVGARVGAWTVSLDATGGCGGEIKRESPSLSAKLQPTISE